MEKKLFDLSNLKKLSREDMKQLKGGSLDDESLFTRCYACGSTNDWGFGCPQGGCSCFPC